MKEEISPKYLMKLITEIEKLIRVEFENIRNAEYYINKWHKSEWHEGEEHPWQNFNIEHWSGGEINLTRTLHNIDGELLLKIAIDLGIETPDFIPSIPQFKNELKENYKTVFETFNKAIKQIEEHPDLAIGLANSTLESIIKEILKDDRIKIPNDKNMTLYKLTEAVLKEFKLFPSNGIPEEIRNIGSSMLNMNQNIENLRSNKTFSHGKTSEDYVINDSMYAYFIINSIATIGLFINSFYKAKYPIETPIPDFEDLPFSENDNLPF
jgi:hypothetical protein